MASYVNRKMLLEGVIKIYRETYSMYDKLAHKSLFQESKNIFIKMQMDSQKSLESYESIYNSLNGDGDCGRTFETGLPDEFDMLTHIKAKRWCTREDALVTSESIEREVLAQLTELKNMFPGLADDIIDDAIARENRQLKFLIDVHDLQLSNNIMI